MEKSNENQQALEQRNMPKHKIKKKRNFLIKLIPKAVSFIANIERVLSLWDRFDQ
ncbi:MULTISPECIES: hypothetical protein [Acinetobacter calcoaceticus/baumannii complex]|uniref:hypothetical protein n=1 Tax=Acinetobacter calcoaceticus/baumannii complex TaxID=909768 RepID=UPI00244A4855|nr:hypothetical protein [Acinetobacter baumannii]MDH2481118.1 hypothetical protein [Acinetobacter baumannii]MDH2502152.1 hypothetical protein [Acinetobacter baumannii]MDV7664703.1 hypothetical protein [Acinetobacter baumannii]